MLMWQKDFPPAMTSALQDKQQGFAHAESHVASNRGHLGLEVMGRQFCYVGLTGSH